MEIREVTDEKYRSEWNKLAGHPMQSWEWGEFRAKTGVKVARWGLFDGGKLAEPIQVTVHPIPHTPWTIGYYPKGNTLTKQHTNVLAEIAKKYRCISIKCEPKVERSDARFTNEDLVAWGYAPGRPLFTKYNFVLDVTPTEETLLANMKQKTRYNLHIAEKRGVTVSLDDSQEAFERYLALTEETTKRQGFYAHSPQYHSMMWKILGNNQAPNSNNQLTAHILAAKYNAEIITTWVLFWFGDTLYYPYGASTREHREVMANNLVMWETIKLAKLWKLKYLDMWGALGPDADPADPWYGFHTFKSGYGARHVEYVGTWDYVANKTLYYPMALAEWARWKILRALKSLH